jgi:hypothetical protein
MIAEFIERHDNTLKTERLLGIRKVTRIGMPTLIHSKNQLFVARACGRGSLRFIVFSVFYFASVLRHRCVIWK